MEDCRWENRHCFFSPYNLIIPGYTRGKQQGDGSQLSSPPHPKMRSEGRIRSPGEPLLTSSAGCRPCPSPELDWQLALMKIPRLKPQRQCQGISLELAVLSRGRAPNPWSFRALISLSRLTKQVPTHGPRERCASQDQLWGLRKPGCLFRSLHPWGCLLERGEANG